jgi:hypothetical protein
MIDRWGVSVLPWSIPKCDGHLFVAAHRVGDTRAPVAMHESVVPMSARKTVKAWTSMKARPALYDPNSHVPTMTIMSPSGAPEAAALVSVYP